MKKIHTLALLTLVLASTSAGCGFLKGGSGQKPAVAAVEPAEDSAGATVTVTLENFNDKRDILLFGGVPVRVTDEAAVAAETATGAKAFADARGSNETPDLTAYTVQTTVTRTVVVPNLDGGPVALTVRRGDYESDSVTFTILSSNSLPKDDAAPAAEGDTVAGDGNTGDDITPTDPGAGPTGDDQGSDMGDAGNPPAGSETPPAETPPPHAAYAALSQGASSFGLNYIRLNWSVAYVDSAFIRVPVNYWYADVISFGQFHGSSTGPFPFGASDSEGGLLEKLASSLLDDDHGSMPFNYCSVPMAGRTNTPHPCYTSNPNATHFNYVDIMIPLASGEKAKAGTWKFRLPAQANVFTVFYRDWSKNVHHQDLKISNPF